VAVDAERAAYLRAYELFEAVQGPDGEAAARAVPAAVEQATARGWGDTAFVLAAAEVVHAVTRSTRPVAELTRLTDGLVVRAETLDAPAFLATALGLRAVAGSSSGNAAGLLRDASRAVALLDDEDAPALDRSTGYVVVAAAFNTLRLWELVDDLYEQAMAIGRIPDAPGQVPAVAVNRVLTRLEWALALIETGADADARHQLERVQQAASDALQHELSPLWRHDVEACSLAALLLLGDDPTDRSERVAWLGAALREHADLETVALLDAAWALRLLRQGRLASAVERAQALGEVGSASSGARGFPLWVRAQVLAAAEPSPATAAQQRHAELLGEQLWQSRSAVLTSASAQIAVERRQAEHERLFRDVHTDALTGLLNRRSFDSWLRRPVDDDAPGTLLLVDIDDFKLVNDSFGHDVGDEVLRVVARLMRARVRFGDLTIRHGGDEFAIIVHDPVVGSPAALDRGAQLVAAVAQTSWSEIRVGLTVSVSVGVAGPWLPNGERRRDPRAIYRAADAALYAAKRSGRGVSLAG
jgi:diguanylate cyclase (GGDEF)-like protein